jgi:hypothetical protein
MIDDDDMCIAMKGTIFVVYDQVNFQDTNNTADKATHCTYVDRKLCVTFHEFIKFTSTRAILHTNVANVRVLFGMNFESYLELIIQNTTLVTLEAYVDYTVSFKPFPQ